MSEKLMSEKLMSKNGGVNASGFDQTSAQTGDRTYNSLVEDHASQLMDELFQELDPNREGLGQPSSPASSAASQLALSVKTDGLEDSLLIPYVEMDAILEPFYSVEPAPTDKTERPLSSYLWLAAAWGAFLGSASLLAFTQFNSFTRSPVGVEAAVPAIATPQPQDIAFATELSESLKSAETVQPLPTSAAIAALPSITPPPLRTEAVSMAALPAAATVPPLKAVGADKKAKPSVGANLQAPQTLALSTLSTRLPVLTGNQTQGTTAFVAPSLPPSLAPQSMPMGRQAKSGVTVNAILDLGPKSAIMISRNGSAQNLFMGQVLDSTGWVFVRVENGQAILQRGNETRAVRDGEQF
jgi:hypothetical protein